MKNDLLPLLDNVLLRKRFMIETLFDKLKSSMGLEHTRHRFPVNTLVHILSCLAADTLAQTQGQNWHHRHPQHHAQHHMPLLILSRIGVT